MLNVLYLNHYIQTASEQKNIEGKETATPYHPFKEVIRMAAKAP
jgi:hypothetical protein